MSTHTPEQPPMTTEPTAITTHMPAPLSARERIAARLLPSIGDVIFACVLFGALLGLQGKILGPDGDLGWGLRIGERVLSQGIPRSEFMLSTTLGHPVVYWEWLSQTLYALADHAWGLNGVAALAALLVAATSLLLYVSLRRRGVSLALSLPLTVLGIGLTSITWTARAQLFSLLLTLLWSELLLRYWRTGNRRSLLALPPLMALWANLHGGFLAGLILLGTALGVAWLFPRQRERARPGELGVALVASALATLVNPWGIGLWTHIAAYAANPLIARYTQEYQSPDFHSAVGLLFLALVFILAGAWLRLTLARAHGNGDTQRVVSDTEACESGPDIRRDDAPLARPSGDEKRAGGVGSTDLLAIATVTVWTVLAFTSVRFVPIWALFALPVLGETLSANIRSSAPSRGLAAVARRFARLDAIDTQVSRGAWSALAIAVVLLTLIGGGALPGTSTGILNVQFSAGTFPVAAVARLRAMGVPPGQGFTTFAWGGYLDESLPEYHVFIDSRSDDYSQRLLSDYADIVGLAPDWRTLLDRYHIRWALLPTGDPLTQALQLAPDWRCAREDAGNVAMLCQRVTHP